MEYRTHNCGELNISDLGKKITLSGWVQKSRRLGQMIFIDLRDKHGITQLVINSDSKFYDTANLLRSEFVIRIRGEVIERKSKNPDINTGEIEISLSGLEILSKAKTTPLIIDDKTDALEEIRMQYRYLDLRRNPIRKNIELRHKIIKSIRNFLMKMIL